MSLSRILQIIVVSLVVIVVIGVSALVAFPNLVDQPAVYFEYGLWVLVVITGAELLALLFWAVKIALDRI